MTPFQWEKTSVKSPHQNQFIKWVVIVDVDGEILETGEIAIKDYILRYDLMTNQNMMPVDLLFTEYFSAVNSQGKRQFGDPRRNVNPFRVLQYNMLEHLGKQSTFSDRGQRHVGNCGSKLKVNSWMKQETFQQKCAMAGMSPCEAGVGTFGALVQYGYHRGKQRSLPGHIEILVGTKGLSCDEVCSNTDKSAR